MSVVKGVCPGCGCTVYMPGREVAEVAAHPELGRCPDDGRALTLCDLATEAASTAGDPAARLLAQVFPMGLDAADGRPERSA